MLRSAPSAVPRRLPAVLLALLALVALAGCGGGSGVADQSASEVLRSTFGPNRAVHSGRLDLRVTATGLQASQQPLEVGLRGPFAGSGSNAQPRFDLDASLTARGVGVTGGVVSTGSAGFLGIGNQSYALDAKTYDAFKQAYAQEGTGTSTTAKGSTLGALGIDPVRWLRDPKKAKSETVAGVKAVHVTASVDVPALLGDVTKILARANTAGAAAAAGQDVQLTDAERQTIQAAVRSSRFDVWTGEDDGLLRRVLVEVDYDVPAAQRDAAGGLTKGTLSLGLTLADLNEKQTIVAPKGAKPISELTSALAQLSAGAGSGTGG